MSASCSKCGKTCGTSLENPSINGYCAECWKKFVAPALRRWLEEVHGFDFSSSTGDTQ